MEPPEVFSRAEDPLLPQRCIDSSQAFVSSPAHLWRLGRERPIERVTARADAAPNATRLTLRPPMRRLSVLRQGREVIVKLKSAAPADANLTKDLTWFDGLISLVEKR